MSWKYIRAAGLEVEAGWKTRRKDLHQDDSLRTSEFSSSASIGELISEPLENPESVENWLKEAYSDISETPVCAAYHIHVSFKHINYYSQCMTKEFYDAFIESTKKWAEDYPIRNDAFWDRINGKNKYCVPEYRAEQQVKCRNKEESRKGELRRTVLNYCFGLHRTIENRLFPTFYTFHAAISATNSYFDFIEDWLDKHPVSEDEILMEVVDEGHFYESNNENLIKEISNKINLKPFNLYRSKNVKIKGGLLGKIRTVSNPKLIESTTIYPSPKVLRFVDAISVVNSSVE